MVQRAWTRYPLSGASVMCGSLCLLLVSCSAPGRGARNSTVPTPTRHVGHTLTDRVPQGATTTARPVGSRDNHSICRAQDLSAQVKRGGGALGTFYIVVRLTNISLRACELRYPQLSMRWHSGRAVLESDARRDVMLASQANAPIQLAFGWSTSSCYGKTLPIKNDHAVITYTPLFVTLKSVPVVVRGPGIPTWTETCPPAPLIPHRPERR